MPDTANLVQCPTHCTVLPPGKFDVMIAESLLVYSKYLMTTAVCDRFPETSLINKHEDRQAS